MATETKATETNATETSYKSYKLENATIKNVLRVKDGDDERINFVTNKTFDTFDFKTKELTQSNSFSIKLAEANRQLAEFIPQLYIANAFLMGANPSMVLISLLMRNAVVNVDRIFRKKGETRENSSDVYTMNLYKSVFTSVELHIDPLFEEPIKKELDKLSNREETERQKKSELTETTTRKVTFGW